MPKNKEFKVAAVFRSARFYVFCLLALLMAVSKAALEVCFSIMFFLWFLENVITQKGKISRYFSRTTLNLPIAALMAVFFLSVLASVDPGLSLKKLFSKWVQYVMLFFFTADIIDSKKKFRVVLFGFSLSLTLILFDGYWQSVSGWDFLYNRPMEGFWLRAHFNGLNPFGGFLILLCPVAIAFLYSFPMNRIAGKIALRRIFKTFRGLVLALSVFCIIFSSSVVSWVALTLSLICAFFCYDRKKALIFFPFFTLPAIAVILSPLFKSRVFEAIRALIYEGGGRIGIWKEYLQEIAKNPFLGKGINTTSVQIAEKYSNLPLVIKANPHSLYLVISVEAGILGLAAFIWLIWRLLFLLLSAKRSLLWYGFFVGIVSFLIVNLADNIWDERIMSLFWVIIGLAAAFKNLYPGKKAQ